MANFTAFVAWIFSALANFLMAEPIIYFTSLFLISLVFKAVSCLFIERN